MYRKSGNNYNEQIRANSCNLQNYLTTVVKIIASRDHHMLNCSSKMSSSNILISPQISPIARGVFLPTSTPSLSATAISSCNAMVEEALEGKRQHKVTAHHVYSPGQCTEIGKYTLSIGPSAACRHFRFSLGHNLPESTARKFRDIYCVKLSKQRARSEPSDSVDELPPKKEAILQL